MPPFIFSGHGIDDGLTPIYKDGLLPEHIFIRSEGAPFIQLFETAIPETDIDQPIYEIGDYLLVFVAAHTGAPTPIIAQQPNWTSLDGVAGNRWSLYGRIATGDALDVFTATASAADLSSVRLMQMISLGSLSGIVEKFQDGATQAGFIANFPIKGIGAGSEPTNTLVINCYSRKWEVGGVVIDPISMLAPGNSAEIQQAVIGFLSPNTHYWWVGWSYQYQAVSAAVPQQNIFHTPLGGPNDVTSQRFRFKSV